MKKSLFFLMLILLCGKIALNAQSATTDATKTVGATGADYSTLKLAFDAINAGSITGAITLQVIASTTETSAAVLNASGSGSASYTSVNIYPTTSGLTISGNLGSPVIDLNGADHVTIDGRVNATGLAIDMTITNIKSGDGNSSTLKFNNDATYNTVKYCVIKGSAIGGDKGILLFSYTATTTGNSNNIIDHNEITNNGGNRPYMAIFSKCTVSTAPNSSNTISNNNIHDVINTNGSSSYVINLSDGSGGGNSYNDAWTITGNSFYDAQAFTYGGNDMRIVYIYATSGNNFTVSNNYIGGNAPLCGGTWAKTTGNNTFSVMEIRVGSSIASNIQGNTIKNVTFTNSGNYIWWGINIQAGTVNIGTTAGNCIGASTGTGSIVYTGSGSNSAFYGIHCQSSNVNVQNNIIGAITTANANATNSSHFYGIYLRSNGGTYSVSYNTIGSTATANSINATSTSTTDAQKVCGLISDGNSGTVNLLNNTVVNLTNGTTNSTTTVYGRVYGIYLFKNTNTITGNLIHDLTIANLNMASSLDPGSIDNASLSAAGIAFGCNSNSSQTISGNTIYNISNTNSSFAGHVAGIYYYGQSTASSIDKNLIYGLSVNSGSSAATIHGIKIDAGVATYSNNIITLGGNTTTSLYGIYDAGSSGTCNIYFNTVYLSGAPASGSRNSSCLYNAGTGNTRNFRNNNFYNARSNSGASGKHYAVYLSGGGMTIDYNDYNSSGTGGCLGYSGGDKTTLADWKTATGQDTHSLNTDPGFANPGGTTAGSYLPSAALTAVTGTGITTDYGGSTRSVTSPEMGAWEQNNTATWNGSADTDWGVAGNWNTSSVPTASTNVIVPAVANLPHVTQAVGSPAACNNLTIESGAVLTIDPAKALTVNGTTTNNAGEPGLVIASGATGTGSLIQSSASVGATIQRYVTGDASLSPNFYHFVSIPVYMASPTSNLFLGSYLNILDATQADPDNNNYYGLWVNLGSPTTTPLSCNTGYMIYYPGDSHTYTFTGTLNTGTFSPNISFGGTYTFNLVPNPYPSAIDWGSSSGWVKSNVGATAWIWNSAGGNYTTLSGPSYVPAGQSFIVMTSGSPVLTVGNSACVHNAAAFYKSGPANTLKITARANNFYDEATVAFNPSATPGFDLDYDGFKLWGLADAPQLWTEAGENRMSVNQLPPVSGSLIIPLDFKTTFAGEVALSFTGTENIDPELPVRLLDKLAGTVTDLRQSSNYTFTHDPSDAEQRFSLIFGYPDGVNDKTANDCKLWISGKSVFINPGDLKGTEGRIEIFNLLGQTLYTATLTLDHPTSLKPPVEGMVLVRLTAGSTSRVARGVIR